MPNEYGIKAKRRRAAYSRRASFRQGGLLAAAQVLASEWIVRWRRARYRPQSPPVDRRSPGH
jgi:hypothetical protein